MTAQAGSGEGRTRRQEQALRSAVFHLGRAMKAVNRADLGDGDVAYFDVVRQVCGASDRLLDYIERTASPARSGEPS